MGCHLYNISYKCNTTPARGWKIIKKLTGMDRYGCDIYTCCKQVAVCCELQPWSL